MAGYACLPEQLLRVPGGHCQVRSPESLQDRALLYTLDVNLPRVEWYIGDGQSELQQTPGFPPNWSVVDPSAILVNPSSQTASVPVDQTGIFRLRYQ